MRPIIVGIDFQNQSFAAMKFAVNMAGRIAAPLHMVFVNHKQIEKDIFQRPAKRVATEAKKRFQELVDKYIYELEADQMSYSIVEADSVVEGLNAEAEKTKASVIVVGTRGRIHNALFSRSLASQIAEDSKVPVVTIKDGAQIKRNIKNILAPIDSSLESRQKLPFTVRLAKIFNANVVIMGICHVDSDSIVNKVTAYVNQAYKYVQEYNIPVRKEMIRSEDVVNSIITYTENNPIDIMVGMTEQISYASNLWKGSFAEQFINKSHIPLVNIQPKEYIKRLSR